MTRRPDSDASDGETVAASRDDIRAATIRRIEHSLGGRFEPGNEVTVLVNGDEIFPAMLEAIEAARVSIDLVTFVYWKGAIADRFGASLADRAREGVRVRVLLDGVGALPMERALVERMRDAGVDVRFFRPPATLRAWRIDHRTHRKILVCDGCVGFTGGVGIAAEWEGDARDPDEWRETHFRVRGPVLAGLRAAFLCNWIEAYRQRATPEDIDVGEECTAPPTPDEHVGEAAIFCLRSTAAVEWSDILLMFELLISSATRRLRITTPYFVPDERSTALLAAASARGVRVELMVSGRHNDSRLSRLNGQRAYATLLDAGIRIFEYDRTMLHAKLLTLDGWLACVGSPNFNQRSVRKDDECCLAIADEALTAELDRGFDDDLSACREIEPAAWKGRGLLQRAAEFASGFVRSEV